MQVRPASAPLTCQRCRSTDRPVTGAQAIAHVSLQNVSACKLRCRGGVSSDAATNLDLRYLVMEKTPPSAEGVTPPATSPATPKSAPAPATDTARKARAGGNRGHRRRGAGNPAVFDRASAPVRPPPASRAESNGRRVRAGIGAGSHLGHHGRGYARHRGSGSQAACGRVENRKESDGKIAETGRADRLGAACRCTQRRRLSGVAGGVRANRRTRTSLRVGCGHGPGASDDHRLPGSQRGRRRVSLVRNGRRQRAQVAQLAVGLSEEAVVVRGARRFF